MYTRTDGHIRSESVWKKEKLRLGPSVCLVTRERDFSTVVSSPVIRADLPTRHDADPGQDVGGGGRGVTEKESHREE